MTEYLANAAIKEALEEEQNIEDSKAREVTRLSFEKDRYKKQKCQLFKFSSILIYPLKNVLLEISKHWRSKNRLQYNNSRVEQKMIKNLKQKRKDI